MSNFILAYRCYKPGPISAVKLACDIENRRKVEEEEGLIIWLPKAKRETEKDQQKPEEQPVRAGGAENSARTNQLHRLLHPHKHTHTHRSYPYISLSGDGFPCIQVNHLWCAIGEGCVPTM